MLDAIDGSGVEDALDAHGVAVLPQLLDAGARRALAALYDEAGEGTFRSRVVMARHGFGRGEYQYFAYPLPPSVAQLRPTLAAADRLLGYTPDLLDSAHATVPDVTKAVEALAPAVAFLRPYTPELTGFIGQFGNIWSLYDSQGHFAHALITVEQGALDNSPPLALPGMTFDSRRTPGANAGQPWTDATGSGPR